MENKINEKLQKTFEVPVLGNLDGMVLKIVNENGNIIKETKILGYTPFFIAFEIQNEIATIWYSDIFENIKESQYSIINEPKKNNARLVITGLQLGYNFIVKRSVQPLQFDRDLNCDCKNCDAEDCENRNNPLANLEIGDSIELLEELIDTFRKGGKPKENKMGMKLHAFKPKDF